MKSLVFLAHQAKGNKKGAEDRFIEKVSGLIHAVLNNNFYLEKEDHDDLHQSICEEIITLLREGKIEGKHDRMIGSFIIRLTKNRGIDLKRKQKRHSVQWFPAIGSYVDNHLDIDLKKLFNEQELDIYFSLIHGATIEEVATRLRITKYKVFTTFHKTASEVEKLCRL